MEFNKYADESSWNEEAKMDAFIEGLHHQVAIKILEMFPGPRSLTALQTIASRIDSRLSNNPIFTQNNSRKNFPINHYKNSKRNPGSSQKLHSKRLFIKRRKRTKKDRKSSYNKNKGQKIFVFIAVHLVIK